MDNVLELALARDPFKHNGENGKKNNVVKKEKPDGKSKKLKKAK